MNRLMGTHALTTGTSNRTSTTVGGVGTSATFNEADEQVNWNIGATRTYTYDLNGNETGSSAAESRGYNSRDQTTSITGLNGTLTPIGYLDSGQSERTSAGGSTYINSSLGIQSEARGVTTYYTHTPGGHLVSQRSPGPQGVTNHYYYLFDGLGSVVGLMRSRTNPSPRPLSIVMARGDSPAIPWHSANIVPFSRLLPLAA